MVVSPENAPTSKVAQGLLRGRQDTRQARCTWSSSDLAHGQARGRAAHLVQVCLIHCQQLASIIPAKPGAVPGDHRGVVLEAEHDKFLQADQIFTVKRVLGVPVIVDVCQEDVVRLVASYVARLLQALALVWEPCFPSAHLGVAKQSLIQSRVAVSMSVLLTYNCNAATLLTSQLACTGYCTTLSTRAGCTTLPMYHGTSDSAADASPRAMNAWEELPYLEVLRLHQVGPDEGQRGAPAQDPLQS